MPEKKWKIKLLKSGLPLEFGAAKLLVSKGFAVNSDFTYARSDSGVLKDFSVDIEATAFPPFTNPNKISAEVVLLVECKHRAPNVKWLFLPDPNDPELLLIVHGSIRVIDEFSAYTMKRNASYEFDAELPLCYKGTEVHFGTAAVYDTEIKHGVAQLRYALPRLFAKTALFMVQCHPEDNVPFLFCPILLTTAELLVIDKGMSIQDVKNVSTVDDLGTKVPYLFLNSDYGPDFETYCSKECDSLAALDTFPHLKILESKRQNSKREAYELSYPSAIGKSLANAERYRLLQYFTQFLVCTYSEFPKLIDTIKKTVTRTIRTRKPL